jgi:DNA-binding HxlR family transcriptional regulator
VQNIAQAGQMRKKQGRRSNCPINFGLETFGDMWSLLIVRDIVYFGKKSYGEFLESDEGIATNILASRLAQLEQTGIVVRRPHETDRRKEVYELTEKGLDLIPILLELANWGAQYDPQTSAPKEWIDLVNADKARMTRLIRNTVQSGGSVFAGQDNVVSQVVGERDRVFRELPIQRRGESSRASESRNFSQRERA